MNWKANWIWLPGDGREPNCRVLARKSFRLNGFDAAQLAVTADTRYRLYVNGHWVNDGPVRSFPWKYSYDRIDVSRYLRPGENVLAVAVMHYGEATFQSFMVRGGLLAQLEIRRGKRKTLVATDETWKLLIDPGYNRLSGRVSCQLPYEEQIDARRSPVGWERPGFDDRRWLRAHKVSPATEGPWKNLTARDIPLLARRPVQPQRVLSVQFVRPPSLVEAVNFKRTIFPDRTDAGHRTYNAAAVTHLLSPTAQTVRLYKNASTACCQIYLNGRLVRYTHNDGFNRTEPHVANIRLKKGKNLLVMTAGSDHYDEVQLILDAPRPVERRNPFGRGKWAVGGPFDLKGPIWKGIQRAKSAEAIANLGGRFRAVPKESITEPDVHGMTSLRTILDGRPVVQNPSNLLADNDEVAVVQGGKGDIELMIDFGREYNAHVALELCAPEGVVLDGNLFEAFHQGRPQWTWMNRSCFRYITRAGWQKYVTLRHFGARYLALTIRNLQGELRLRRVHPIFIHHQAEDRGQFYCDDPVLNEAWSVSKQTLLCCMEDTFTDCPTFEQTYWVGDGRNEALICQAVFGEPGILRRCCELPALSLQRSDLTESQVPSGWQNILTAWSFLWVMMCREYYQFTGDFRTLQQVLYPATVKMLRTCQEKYYDDNGLMTIDTWNMFDWSAADQDHPCVAHNNMFLVEAFRCAAEMAKELHRPAEARRWTKATDDLVRAINRHFWSARRSAYIDSIHRDGKPSTTVSRPTNMLALLYDVAPPERAKKILPIVLNRAGKGVVEFGSPFAMFYLLEYYAKSRRYERILQTVRELWGEMLSAGATTFWEMFHSPASTEYPTRSHCHAWSAGPAFFLSRYILGVHPLKNGFTEALIQPYLGTMRHARGTVPANRGNIDVEWRRKKGELTVNLRIPPEVRATFAVPDGFAAKSVQVNRRKVSGRLNRPIRLPRRERFEIVVTE